MIPLNSEQRKRCERLFDELKDLSQKERRARLAEIEAEDPAIATVLRYSFSEEPSFRGLKHGDMIGEYTLDKRLGTGGCGEVWLAQQNLKRGPRDVAVKLIRPDHLMGGDASAYLKRFEDEIEILMGLGSEGIAHLYDADIASLPGQDIAIPYFVMEYVPGKPITEALRPRDIRTQVACFEKVCEAVQHAHNYKEGILHRDLKPPNILVIERGGSLIPKVLDFGLARFFDPIRPLVAEHLGEGTLPYMAPEQIDPALGGENFRTDVHALGVILFQVLTAQLPHGVPDGDTKKLIRAICHDSRRKLRDELRHPPDDLRPTDLEALETLVARAMAINRGERFRTPIEFAQALAHWRVKSASHIRQSSAISRVTVGRDAQGGNIGGGDTNHGTVIRWLQRLAIVALFVWLEMTHPALGWALVTLASLYIVLKLLRRPSRLPSQMDR